jgi:hypothetical protein
MPVLCLRATYRTTIIFGMNSQGHTSLMNLQKSVKSKRGGTILDTVLANVRSYVLIVEIDKLLKNFRYSLKTY